MNKTNHPKKHNFSIDEAQKLYDSGMSLQKVAKVFGCAASLLINRGIITRNHKTAMKNFERKFSPEGLKSLSSHAKRRNLGGYRPHPNKGTRYNGIWFDSKWELMVAKSLDENSIKWTRPKNGFVWNDKGNKYYPDFHLTDYDIFLDPKNEYLRKKDSTKIAEAQKRNNIRVIVLREDQLDWFTIKALIV